MSNKEIWRDITDPRRAEYVDDLEAGLKEPEFENLQIPEHLGPVQEKIDDHKIKRYAFEIDEYNPWFLEKSPFYDGARIGGAGMLVNARVRRVVFGAGDPHGGGCGGDAGEQVVLPGEEGGIEWQHGGTSLI